MFQNELLFEKVLLRSDDRSRPTYPEPSDDLGGRHAIVFHNVAGDQGAGASEAGLAVDGESAVALLRQVDEALDNALTGRAAVDEEHVLVLEAGLGETLGVVDLLVEAHDAAHVVLAKVGHVCLGRVQRVAVLDLAFGVRTAKGYKLAGQHPVQISVLHFLLTNHTSTNLLAIHVRVSYFFV